MQEPQKQTDKEGRAKGLEENRYSQNFLRPLEKLRAEGVRLELLEVERDGRRQAEGTPSASTRKGLQSVESHQWASAKSKK